MKKDPCENCPDAGFTECLLCENNFNGCDKMLDQKYIDEKIKEAHKIAVEKGFYDCPNCKGEGVFPGMEDVDSCPVCNETGIDPNKNISQLLLLINSEISEALEAHRKNKFADIETYKYCLSADDMFMDDYDYYIISEFEKNVKNTFEDEIADVFIRIFDFCGYTNYPLKIDTENEWTLKKDGVGFFYQLFNITTYLFQNNPHCFFNGMLQFCQELKIDIKKHIDLKMAYNKTRPYKHGKEY